MGIVDSTRSFVPLGTPDPDLDFRDTLTLEVGGEQFVLRHALGETNDHAWTEWVGHETLFVGDFLIWNFPNCGNPQKVLRYPAEWAAALRAMDAQSPAMVAPAHGLPVQTPARAARVLGTIAEALEGLVSGVINLLNQRRHARRRDPQREGARRAAATSLAAAVLRRAGVRRA